MTQAVLLPDLVRIAADRTPGASALSCAGAALDYASLNEAIEAFAGAVVRLGLRRGERVAVFLEKRIEAVVATFGTAAAGAVFVPINPILKPAQVAYILRDCDVRILVTSGERARLAKDAIMDCPELGQLVLVDADPALAWPSHTAISSWSALIDARASGGHRVIDSDVLAILYTSGSTGKPKGVVLSHRN
ncbi:MAG TPA: AMP-binding protein, partial [Casimicrobiaceae bacterium]|nr:AMP-binding protein [Casimicrobiaceae bacterium]